MKVENVENVFVLKKMLGKLGESYVAQVIVARAAILYLVASISTLQISC